MTYLLFTYIAIIDNKSIPEAESPSYYNSSVTVNLTIEGVTQLRQCF